MTMYGIGELATADAEVRYRIDGTGERIGVLPATCRATTHSLHAVGYRAFITEGDGTLQISCNACPAANNPDHYWWLTLNGPAPERAELDDEPYRDVAARLRPRGGTPLSTGA